MSIGMLLLAIWLLMMGFVQTGLIAIPSLIMGIFALVAGVLLILEGVSVISYRINR